MQEVAESESDKRLGRPKHHAAMDCHDLLAFMAGCAATKPRQCPDWLLSLRVWPLLESMQVPVTVHGFRSTFRDWCGETTGFPHAAIEKCLPHEVASAVERAFAQSDLLDKHRQIMAAWAAYVQPAIGRKASSRQC